MIERKKPLGAGNVRAILSILLPLLLAGALDAQPFLPDPRYDRNGVPDWKIDKEFGHDVFTFVRVRYASWNGRHGKWSTDYPDSDLNFSYRLQQLTSLQVDPNGKILELSDKELFNYPFLYMIEPGHIEFRDDEIKALRKYLLNGGFLDLFLLIHRLNLGLLLSFHVGDLIGHRNQSTTVLPGRIVHKHDTDLDAEHTLEKKNE